MQSRSTVPARPGAVRRDTPLARSRAVALCAAVALVSAGCATPASGDQTAPAAANVIKVGYLGDLSAGGSGLALPAANGIQLAVDEINARGGVAGRPLELVTVDSKADPTTAVAGAKRLVATDKVVAVLGGTDAATTAAANAVITGAGVPHLITTAQADGLLVMSSAGFPMTFRITENDSYDVDAVASLLQERAYHAICALADSGPYGDGGRDSIQSVFAGKYLRLLASERYPVNANDLTTVVSTLRTKGCDVVYFYGGGHDAATFVKTINRLGWKVPVVAGRALATKEFLSSLAGAVADGLIIPGVVDPAKPGGKTFVDSYSRRFGTDDDPAHISSALAYDAMRMLADALDRTRAAGGIKLAAALESASLTDAASGRAGSTLSFSTNRHQAPGRDFLLFYEVRGGIFRFLTSDVESGH